MTQDELIKLIYNTINEWTLEEEELNDTKDGDGRFDEACTEIRGLIACMKYDRAKAIEQRIKDADEVLISWHVEDVLECRNDLTREQAQDVLQSLKNGHDATIGINWDTIYAHAETLYPEQ